MNRNGLVRPSRKSSAALGRTDWERPLVLERLEPREVPAFTVSGPFAVGTHPIQLTYGLFDADDHVDLAVTNVSSTDVSVLLGNGNGTFGAPTNLYAGSNPYGIKAADLNHDGKADLVVSNAATLGFVSVLLGNGNGTFGYPTPYAVGATPVYVALGDFTNDGELDVATANAQGGGSVSVLPGNGGGTFGAAVTTPLAGNPFALDAADFNHDGNLDLAVVAYFSNNMRVLLGNGNGTFQPPVTYATGSVPHDVAVGDLNHDNYADVLVPDFGSNTVHVYLNRADNTGTFTSSMVALPVGASGPEVIGIADFNRDRKPDFVTGNYGANNNVTLFRNNGNGTFQAGVNYATPGVSGARGMLARDLTKDRYADVVVTGYSSDNFDVLVNDKIWPPGPPGGVPGIAGLPPDNRPPLPGQSGGGPYAAPQAPQGTAGSVARAGAPSRTPARPVATPRAGAARPDLFADPLARP
jgi:hypothetical protein